MFTSDETFVELKMFAIMNHYAEKKTEPCVSIRAHERGIVPVVIVERPLSGVTIGYARLHHCSGLRRSCELCQQRKRIQADARPTRQCLVKGGRLKLNFKPQDGQTPDEALPRGAL